MNRIQALQLLGLNDNYTDDELKSAYRKKAHKYHPDLNHDADAPMMFMQMKEAHDFLVQFGRSARSVLLTHKSIFVVTKR